MRPVHSPRILAVDDKPENLLALQAILQGLPLDLHTVDSGERALKKLMTVTYAAILLDAQMPGMDGFETAGRIKQRERTRNIPVIFLTAADYDPQLVFRGYQVGAVDYLTKPFDPWVLRSKVMVFADLWSAHSELARQAVDYANLCDAVDNAIDLLDSSEARGEEAADMLRAARRSHGHSR